MKLDAVSIKTSYPHRIEAPMECNLINDISRVGCRHQCPAGAWVHINPEPRVCDRCFERNGMVKA